MARRIRAPAKILWKLRFKNTCMVCGKVIPEHKTICDSCNKKKKKR